MQHSHAHEMRSDTLLRLRWWLGMKRRDFITLLAGAAMWPSGSKVRMCAGGQHGQEAQQWADAPIFEDPKR